MKKIITFIWLFALTFSLSQAVIAKGKGKRLGRFFKTADTNGDKKLSLSEMQTKAQERFSDNDLNNDGIITTDELNTRVAQRFTEADADANGQLEKKEIRKHFKDMFASKS